MMTTFIELANGTFPQVLPGVGIDYVSIDFREDRCSKYGSERVLSIHTDVRTLIKLQNQITRFLTDQQAAEFDKNLDEENTTF